MNNPADRLPMRLPSRICLALVGTTGILYSNVSPMIVSALIRADGIGSSWAGLALTSNTLGTGVGGLLAILLARHAHWRRNCALALIGMAGADLISILATSPVPLMFVRFSHGIAAGTLIGVIMTVIARRDRPERTLLVYLFFQLMLGGVLMLFAFDRAVNTGAGTIWAFLAACSVAGLLLLPLIERGDGTAETAMARSPASAGGQLVGLALGALIIYQIGEMAVFAFVVEIGVDSGLAADEAGRMVALSLLIGAPLALLMAWRPSRSAFSMPVTGYSFAMATAISLLLIPGSAVFFVANLGFTVFFCASCSYFFAVAAGLDNSGRVAAMAGFASTIGESLGPALGGLAAESGEYQGIVLMSIGCVLVAIALIARPAVLLQRRLSRGQSVWDA